MSNMTSEPNIIPMPPDFCSRATEKITAELKSFSGGTKETAVSEFVASTITRFSEEDQRFAEVVFKTKKTLSHVCAEVMKGCGNYISDIDVYRKAVKAYFPNADIRFLMQIEINGAPPSEEDMAKEPVVPAKKAKPKKEKAKKPIDKNPMQVEQTTLLTSIPEQPVVAPVTRTKKTTAKDPTAQDPDIIQLTLF